MAEGLGRRHYLLLAGVFLATRLALWALGFRLQLDLRWMFLSDLTALREHLLETVLYFHAFAPGMNLITGVLLKLTPAHLLLSSTILFWASGYLLLAASCRLFHLLGCSRWTATALALALSLIPPSLYLEHLYLYTHLCTSLVCWAAVAFALALRSGSTRAWFGFFLLCALLGWLYTTFHLLWFLMLGGVGLLCTGRGRRRSVLLGAALPLVLLTGLYAKNYALFGVFGATSWGGANVTLSTTQRMPAQIKQEWIESGWLSPFAGISVFAGPQEYLRLLPPDLHFPWPGSNELTRPSVGAPNFNHGLFLQVNRQRAKDASYFIRHAPLEYLRNVFAKNLPALFSSTTHWHAHDKRPTSPHHLHRQVLGKYEHLYDELVHSWPLRPVGLYLFLPLFVVWSVMRCWRGLRSGVEGERQQAVLLVFCLLQIAFVVSASTAFSSVESARYRYAVEPFIWAVVAVGLCDLAHWLRQRTPRWKHVSEAPLEG